MLKARCLLTAFFLMMGIFGTMSDARAEDQTSKQPAKAAVQSRLFLIGGNANTTLDEFARLAGGAKKAAVAIITYAGDKPIELADAVQNAFSAANVRKTFVISADDKKACLPKEANAVYIGGGNESRLMRLMPEGLAKQLANFDGIIGANSAAAMAAPETMISGGLESSVIHAQQLKLADGMDLIRGIIVDSHVGQRGRDARCIASLASVPEAQMVIGLDEDTAVLIDGRNATVFGAGHARVYRKGPGFATNLNSVPRNAVASVQNTLVSYFSHGDKFELPLPVAVAEKTAHGR